MQQATTTEICHHLLSIRYLAALRNRVEKSEAFYRDILPSLLLNWYQHFLYASPQSMYYCRADNWPSHLHDEMNVITTPVQKQLAVALRYLACEYSSGLAELDAPAVTPRAMWDSAEENFFEDEYLLGDSAYPCPQRLICPFTR